MPGYSGFHSLAAVSLAAVSAWAMPAAGNRVIKSWAYLLSRSASAPSERSRNDVPAVAGISRSRASEENKHKKTTLLGGFFINKQKGKLSFVGWKNVLPGIELFSQGAAPQLLSPLLRFTPEFEMDRGGTTAPWTPG